MELTVPSLGTFGPLLPLITPHAMPILLTSFSTPEEIRSLAREEVQESGRSHQEIANELGVARPNVTKALSEDVAPTRYLKITRRILEEVFEYDIGEEPRFRLALPEDGATP